MPTPDARRDHYQEILDTPPPDRAAELPELYANLERLGLDLATPVVLAEALANQAQPVVDPHLRLRRTTD